MQIPRPLTKGDTVAVTATSGICNTEKLENGVQKLKDLGLQVKVMDSCYASHGSYLAGEDSLRLNDLHAAFADKSIKGIFAARGGYGAARLLPCLNYELIRRNPKIFVGFSDVTALHIVLNQFCGLATFHGPMPASCGSNFTVGWAFHLPAAALYPGRAAGILTGGNLSIIASTLGTPYEIKTRGRILFLEETKEEPYRVDRLLLQLKLAGKFKDAAGIAFGDFSPESLDTLHTAIQELVISERKPAIWGLPCGHTTPNITLPLGQTVTLLSQGLQTETLHPLPYLRMPQNRLFCQTMS
ncbi:MAG: LD-carboxypeptidase [Firmicutes bacterium]|nr:LD-carboxypeptidase [Bacillota bacterium]